MGTSADIWQQRMKELFARSRLLGSYFATDVGFFVNWPSSAAFTIWTILWCPDDSRSNILTQREIELMVDWLRGDRYEPAATSDANASTKPAAND